MTVLLQNAMPGVLSRPLNVKRLGDLLVVGSGSVPGDKVNIYVSGSAAENDFILFGSVTVPGFLEKLVGDIEMNPFERIYAEAPGANAGTVSAYLQTSR